MNKHSLAEYIDLLKRYSLLTPAGLAAADALDGSVAARTVELVSYDSQNVVEGTLFICKGAHFKARYLSMAADRGAFLYVSDRSFDGTDLPYLEVSNLREAIARLAAFYYNDPWNDIRVTGITGTKGKSSTAYYVKAILDEHQRRMNKGETGVVGGIDTYDGVERFESHLTTPEPIELFRHLRHAADSGLDYVTMEVSSQALKYDRTLGLEFTAAVFLNIGYDHISPIEHPDWNDYFHSKLRIFDKCRTAVVNLDSDHTEEILDAAKKAPALLTFSEKDETADVFGYNIRKEQGDTVFCVRTKDFDKEFRLGMAGLFNVQNALAAIAVAVSYGCSYEEIYTGLVKARVPGRMEIYTNADKTVTCIVDYAHNRLSFEKLFASVRAEYPGRRVVIVFGCPGKKALDRRHDLGQIAGRCSDHVYLTEEDPGEEDAVAIAEEIALAVKAENCPFSIEPDRGKAIRMAVSDCDRPTVVLITGKGAETREKRGLDYIPVPSDIEYTKEALAEYDKAHYLDGTTQVQSLLRTLPRLQALNGRRIVIKYGGSALSGTDAVDSILEDVAVLRMAGAKVVLVHGGGKDISGWLKRMNVEAHFEQGYRVTDDLTMSIAEMTLSGLMNKKIVADLKKLNVKGVGISGRDAGLITARKKELDGIDLGHVGVVSSVDPQILEDLLDKGYVPVVSPVAMDEEENPLNVNADDSACMIAEAIHAEELIFLSDVDGIYADVDNDKTLLPTLSASYARDLLKAGIMSQGMIRKVEACIHACENGISKVIILDGRVEHTVLLESVTNEVNGTVIVPDKK